MKYYSKVKDYTWFAHLNLAFGKGH